MIIGIVFLLFINILCEPSHVPEDIHWNLILCCSVFLPYLYYQALEKQKRRTEEEQKRVSEVKRELQSANETLRDLDKKRVKLEHDIQVKDQHASCIESQLAHTKSLLDTDNKKVSGIHQFINQFSCCKLKKNDIVISFTDNRSYGRISPPKFFLSKRSK